MDDSRPSSSRGNKPFVSKTAPYIHFFSPKRKTPEILLSQAMDQNYSAHISGTETASSELPSSRTPPHLRRTPTIPPSTLATLDLGATHTWKPAISISRSSSPVLSPEQQAQVLKAPHLRATTSSNLSLMSELCLSDSKEHLPGSTTSGNSAATSALASVLKPKGKETEMKCPGAVAVSKVEDNKVTGASGVPHKKLKTTILDPSMEEKFHTHIFGRAPRRPIIGPLEAHSLTFFPPLDHLDVPSSSGSNSTAAPVDPVVRRKPSGPRQEPPRTPSRSTDKAITWNSFAPGTSTTRSRLPPQTIIAASATTRPSSSSGTPSSPRGVLTMEPIPEKAMFFSQWPSIGSDRPKALPRTVVISEMPDDPTLSMVSSICRGTGMLESVSMLPATRKAMVWFIESASARRFFDRTGNGLVFYYERAGKQMKKTVFVELKDEVDVLSSAMRSKVDSGYTRVIRIVGWQKKDLVEIVGGSGEESEGELLTRLAEKCVYEGKLEKIESVSWHANSLGFMEASLTFAGIKEANFTITALKKLTPLEGCNIAYGRDPCSP